MANKNWKWYVGHNDFEGAKQRFENAYKNWKQHWFDTCVEIFNNSKEWAKKYILDPITLTIEPIIQKTTKKQTKRHAGESHTYIIKMFNDCGKYVFLKNGKADDVSRRMRELSKQEYKRDGEQIARVEVLKTYDFPSADLAESFEKIVHNYLTKFFSRIPNDRYEPAELTTEQYGEIDRMYNTFLVNFA